MDFIFTEIAKSLECKLYYAAFLMALTLPDICAALESDNGRTTGARYKAWLNSNYLNGRPTSLNANSLYQYRCGIVHQSSVPGDESFRIVFAVNPNPKMVAHDNYTFGPAGQEIMYDLRVLCNELVEAARTWFAAHENDPNVKVNLPKLIKEENRRMPMIGLVPVIL
jgi:hypothetical protein